MDYLSWQRRPHIASCKLFLTLLRAKLAVFAKCISGICEEAKNTKMGCFFSSILTTLKRPKKLIHGCLPKIWIDPYIWQPPSYVLTTVWEDLALNAGTLPTIGIDPYFWQTPSNVLITGLEEKEALNACDPYFWQTIHFFWQSLEGHIKWPPIFSPRFIFLSGSFPRQLFFAKKTSQELRMLSRSLSVY